MDATIMIKHISMWKQALAFLLKSNVWLNYNPGVKAVLEVLKLLYKVSGQFRLPYFLLHTSTAHSYYIMQHFRSESRCHVQEISSNIIYAFLMQLKIWYELFQHLSYTSIIQSWKMVSHKSLVIGFTFLNAFILHLGKKTEIGFIKAKMISEILSKTRLKLIHIPIYSI